MEIKRSAYAQGYGVTGERSPESIRGPAEYFTGTVRIDPLFEAPEPARVRGALFRHKIVTLLRTTLFREFRQRQVR